MLTVGVLSKDNGGNLYPGALSFSEGSVPSSVLTAACSSDFSLTRSALSAILSGLFKVKSSLVSDFANIFSEGISSSEKSIAFCLYGFKKLPAGAISCSGLANFSKTGLLSCLTAGFSAANSSGAAKNACVTCVVFSCFCSSSCK